MSGLPTISRNHFDQVDQSAGGAKPTATESGDTLTATAGELSLQISKNTGLLVSASRQGKSFPWSTARASWRWEPRLLLRRAQQGQPAPPPRHPPLRPIEAHLSDPQDRRQRSGDLRGFHRPDEIAHLPSEAQRLVVHRLRLLAQWRTGILRHRIRLPRSECQRHAVTLAKGPHPSIRIVSPAVLSTSGIGRITTPWSAIRTTSSPESTSTTPSSRGTTQACAGCSSIPRKARSPRWWTSVPTQSTCRSSRRRPRPKHQLGKPGVVPECRSFLPARHPGGGQQVRGAPVQWSHGAARGCQGEYKGHISLYFGKLLAQSD